MPVDFFGNIQCVCDDKYYALKMDDLYIYLNDNEKRKFSSYMNGNYNLSDRESVIIQSKVAKLKKIHREIYSQDNPKFDVKMCIRDRAITGQEKPL